MHRAIHCKVFQKELQATPWSSDENRHQTLLPFLQNSLRMVHCRNKHPEQSLKVLMINNGRAAHELTS